MIVKDIIHLVSISDLKIQPVASDTVVFLLGGTTPYDGMGGIYRWDASSTATEELVYMNIISSSISSTGRWVRVFQRVRVLPHGFLSLNGLTKSFYANGVTDSTGKCTLNLTLDGTATGIPIFTEVWLNHSQARAFATVPGDAVQSFRVSLASDLKQTVHGFYKSNVLSLTLGLLYNPAVMVGANIPVTFKIEGV